MSFLSQLMNASATDVMSAEQCSSLLRQLERQFKTGPDDPEKPMRIQGQDELVHRLVMAVVLNEHVLLEGLPGVAKTTAVELLSRDTGLTCRRIQFVPDMQPSDLIGKDQINLAALSSSGTEADTGFRYWENGPLFQNIVIADEINRAPAKVQAALLESMAERAITPFGKTQFVIRSQREWNMWLRWVWRHPVFRTPEVWGSFWSQLSGTSQLSEEAMREMGRSLAEQHWELFGPEFPWRDRSAANEDTFGASCIDLRKPKDAQFAVFATMNPIEQEGTYPLSEAQTDRFCFKTLVKYPSYAALRSITRMINPPAGGTDPDLAFQATTENSDEAIRRSLYFFRRCREVMFGRPGDQGDSLMANIYSAAPAENGSSSRSLVDVVSRVVFYSHLRQPEPGSRRTQQMTQLLKDPEQIERQARLMREDSGYADLLKEDIWQFVKSGASPRAQMFLVKAAVCECLLGDDSNQDTTLAHVRRSAHDVLRHRIRMNVQAHVRGIHPEDVVDVLMQRFAPIADQNQA